MAEATKCYYCGLNAVEDGECQECGAREGDLPDGA